MCLYVRVCVCVCVCVCVGGGGGGVVCFIDSEGSRMFSIRALIIAQAAYI